MGFLFMSAPSCRTAAKEKIKGRSETGSAVELSLIHIFLMTALLGDCLADLFTVGHVRRVEHDLDAEAALELAHQHVDLNVARAGDDHLVGLGVVDDAERRVFLVQAVEALGHLILLAAGLGRDGHAVAGLIEMCIRDRPV